MDNSLLDRINQLIILSASQQADLSDHVEKSQHPKGHMLLEPGEICEQIYFVRAGVLRSHCMVDGKEVTRWFAREADFATDYFSFVYRQPSENFLVTVTDVELISLSYFKLQDLCQKDPVWVDLNRRLLEKYYLSTLERVMQFQTLSTAERYQLILDEAPGIEQQVSLGHLASFLGMSQETLSRLRHQRRKRSPRSQEQR